MLRKFVYLFINEIKLRQALLFIVLAAFHSFGGALFSEDQCSIFREYNSSDYQVINEFLLKYSRPITLCSFEGSNPVIAKKAADIYKESVFVVVNG